MAIELTIHCLVNYSPAGSSKAWKGLKKASPLKGQQAEKCNGRAKSSHSNTHVPARNDLPIKAALKKHISCFLKTPPLAPLPPQPGTGAVLPVHKGGLGLCFKGQLSAASPPSRGDPETPPCCPPTPSSPGGGT